MSKGAQRNLSKSEELPFPSIYVNALHNEYSDWAFNERVALEFKGVWNEKVFADAKSKPLDLEIGTGNGTHFEHRAFAETNRNLLGIELKYKPLIQTIRRVVARKGTNARMIRYNAVMLTDLFKEAELDNVYIHFPDPWPRKKQNKHRLINTQFLDDLFKIQKQGSFIEFKTDNEDYFYWAQEFFKDSKYHVTFETLDLHNSEVAENNFKTAFEHIFLKKGQPIYYTKLLKEG